MLEFHYNVLEKPFKNKYTVPYDDTDSFGYNITHPFIYEWIKENKQHVGLSDYTRDDMRSDQNKNK